MGARELCRSIIAGCSRCAGIVVLSATAMGIVAVVQLLLLLLLLVASCRRRRECAAGV